MGLAEPRKRLKLSHDPNNLHWSQNTSSYGARILSSHGWTPGSTLGAKDARHASHFTSASSSHIRIKIKDDNLGLGAQTAGKLAAQSRQVDAFQGLLGRLNGRSDEEIKKEEKKGEDFRLALYAQGKWGGMQFVRGGILVQGKDFKEGVDRKDVPDVTEEEEKKRKEKRNKKEDDNGARVEETEEDTDIAKRRRKEEKRRRKEERLLRKQKAAGTESSISTPMTDQESESSSLTSSSSSRKESKGKRKEEKLLKKLAKKEAKRQREKEEEKERKRKREDESSSSSSESESDSRPPSTSPSVSMPTPTNRSTSSTPTPAPLPRTGRHLLRSKNIMSKRMAFQDVNGLDGIFMKATSS